MDLPPRFSLLDNSNFSKFATVKMSSHTTLPAPKFYRLDSDVLDDIEQTTPCFQQTRRRDRELLIRSVFTK